MLQLTKSCSVGPVIVMIVVLAMDRSYALAQSAEPDTAIHAKSLTPFAMNLSGFVDIGFANNLRSRNSTFGFEQAELDIDKSIAELGAIRIDFEMTNAQSEEFDYSAEQGYIMLNPVSFGPVEIVFGKFNAPIGLEGSEPTELFQCTDGLISEYCLPGNLTGLMITSGLRSGLDIALHVSNGWDNNFDENDQKTAGGQLCYSYGERLSLAIAALSGKESDSTDGNLSVYDFNFTIMPLNNLLFGGEINFGRQAGSGAAGEWRGGLVVGNLALSEHLSISCRYDYLNDRDGLCFGGELSETRQAATFASRYSPGYGLSAIAEYRIDLSSRDTFKSNSGELYNDESAIAFEMVYEF